MSNSIKVLIVANEPLSNASANGRTLRNFLLNVPKEHIAQFYIHGTPDAVACSNYFQVSDRDALDAFLFKKRKRSCDQDVSSVASGEQKKIKRNCKTMVLRDIVWKSYRWWSIDFDNFVENFSPDLVLFQAGDAPFMYFIALKISQKHEIPLVMYNSEEYVLKEKLYNSAVKNSIWHKWLQHRLKKAYNSIMKRTSFCIYNTEYLEQAYQKEFPHQGKSCVLHTVSELGCIEDKSGGKSFSLLYCGNLGVGRVEPLDELAKVLFKIDSSAILNVYGTFSDEESKDRLCLNSNVHYGGVVSYDEIPMLMSEASMLIHCENADRINNLRGAFSTKIADSLASGMPFLVYASKEYPFVQYLEKYDCAHIATNAKELEDVLRKCIIDPNYRKLYTKKAHEVAQCNHSVMRNCMYMERILKAVKQNTGDFYEVQ